MRHMAAAWLGWLGVLGGCDSLWGSYTDDHMLCDRNDPTLVLCLQFEGQVVDESANQIPITGGPVAEYVDGVVGRAAHFDGKTPTIMLGDSKAWGVSEFTLEAWVRPDALPTSRFGIMDREGAYSMFLYPNAEQNSLALSCTTNDAAVRGLQIPIGTFSHIACTFKNGEQILYLNGVAGLQDGQPIAAPNPGPLTHFFGSNVPSGGRPDPDALVGALDEFRFFAKSRSADEIRAAYARFTPTR